MIFGGSFSKTDSSVSNSGGRISGRSVLTAVAAFVNPVVSNRHTIKPGTRLVRQWKEQVHVVEVEAEGYAYRGSRYENLSEIARLITGTRWPGPLFFGLRSKPSTEIQEAQ